MDNENRELIPTNDRHRESSFPDDALPDRQTVCTRLLTSLQKLRSRSFWKAVLLGQLVSLLLCGTGVTSGLLTNKGINIPTAQSFLNYILLCVVFTVLLACRKHSTGDRSIGIVFRTWGWKYLLVAVADVEANYLLVKAYQYTTVTSVQVLDCFSIPCVMILSYLVLRTCYKMSHVVGVVICVLGLGGLILGDILSGNIQSSEGKAPNKALGDVLVLAGASLYAVSNTTEEYVVKKFDKTEFLAMLGLFGSFINGIQFALLERNELASVNFSVEVVALLVVFTVCQFLQYVCITVFIQVTSATAMNISILSADFYALLFGIFLFKYQFHIIYLLSFVVIILGITIYILKPTSTRERTASQDQNTSTDVR